MKNFKDSNSVTSDDHFYINILYILAQRGRRRSWLKGYARKAWALVDAETLDEAFKPFVDSLKGDIDMADTQIVWSLFYSWTAIFEDPKINILGGLEMIYLKKFPDLTIPAPLTD